MPYATPEDRFIYSDKVQDEIRKSMIRLYKTPNLAKEIFEDFAWKIHEIVENE